MSCQHFSYKDAQALYINFVFLYNSMYCYVKCSVPHQKVANNNDK